LRAVERGMKIFLLVSFVIYLFSIACLETESQADSKPASIVGLALSNSSRYSSTLNTKALMPIHHSETILDSY
jgi:hypothetical protein